MKCKQNRFLNDVEHWQIWKVYKEATTEKMDKFIYE
jgi:hypothetical protein